MLHVPTIDREFINSCLVEVASRLLNKSHLRAVTTNDVVATRPVLGTHHEVAITTEEVALLLVLGGNIYK